MNRRRLRLAWCRFGDRVYHWRYRLLAAVLGRIATEQMRHAALLLGYALAFGYGEEGVLGALPEFLVGNELGLQASWGRGGGAARAVEAFDLERLRFARVGLPFGGAS